MTYILTILHPYNFKNAIIILALINFDLRIFVKHEKYKKQLFHNTTLIDINIDSCPFVLKNFHHFWECLFSIINDLMSKIYSLSLHFNNTMNISTHRLNKLDIFYFTKKTLFNCH